MYGTGLISHWLSIKSGQNSKFLCAFFKKIQQKVILVTHFVGAKHDKPKFTYLGFYQILLLIFGYIFLTSMH